MTIQNADRSGDHVRNLLSAIHEALMVDVTPLRTDLDHMRTLLQSAMGELQRSFFGLDAQVQAQTSHVQALFSTIEDTQSGLKEQLEKTSAAVAEVTRMLSLRGAAREQSLPAVSAHIEQMLVGLSALDQQTCGRLEQLERLAREVKENVNAAVRALQFEDMATQLIACAQRRIDRVETVANRVDQVGGGQPSEHAVEELKRHSADKVASPVAQQRVSDATDVEFF